MLTPMLGIAAAQFQVFKAIVISDVVFVVNVLCRKKITPKVRFHHKPVLKNVPLGSSSPSATIGMVGGQYVNVALCDLIPSLEIPGLPALYEPSSCWVDSVFHTASVPCDR